MVSQLQNLVDFCYKFGMILRVIRASQRTVFKEWINHV